MKRVLHITGALEAGGVETMLYNYYYNMDKEKLQFDFVVFGSDRGKYEHKFEALGCRIYHIDPFEKTTFFKHLYKLHLIISKNPGYNTIHVHRNIVSFMYLFIGAINRIPQRISHCHGVKNIKSSDYKSRIKNRVYRILNSIFATDYFACSQSTAEYMYGKGNVNKVTILKNAIDLSKFNFNIQTRKEIREELGLEGKFVVGNIARFSKEKNHQFIIEVLYELKKINKSCILLLVGEGPCMEEIKEKTITLGLEEDVIFLGTRFDIERILHGIDVFLLPSLYEGLGIALLEAQSLGVKSIASTQVPVEVNISGMVHYLPLKIGSKLWAKAVNEHSGDNLPVDDYNKTRKRLKEMGYDVYLEAKKLEKHYSLKQR